MTDLSSAWRQWREHRTWHKEALHDLTNELNERKPSVGQLLALCSQRGLWRPSIGSLTYHCEGKDIEVLTINYWVRTKGSYWAYFTGDDQWRLHVRFQPPDEYESASLEPAFFKL